MRRILAVFTAFFFVFCSLPLFVSADLPDNDFSGDYHISLLELDDSSYLNFAQHNDPSAVSFSYGDLYILAFTNRSPSQTSGRVTMHFNIEFSLSAPADFYFLTDLTDLNSSVPTVSMVPTLVLNKDTNEQIPSSSITTVSPFLYSGPYFSLTYFYSFSDSSIVSFPMSSDQITSFLSFNCIPSLASGRYLLHFKMYFDSPLGDFNIPLGFFLDQTVTGDPIIDFEDGEITFSEATQQIRDDMNNVINDPSSTDAEKQVAIGIANSKLEMLQSVSDSKYAVVVDSFDDNSSDIVDSYIVSGSTDILPVVSQLNLLFADALTQAVTPEQGTLINTRYSVKLQQLKTVFDVNYKKELDGALSEEDFDDKQAAMDRTDELLQIESDALQIFEDSEYQSYLTFVDWIHSTTEDPTVYRSIFEFLFEDPRSSSVHPFLIIPFSLVLVGVILATTTVVFRRRS